MDEDKTGFYIRKTVSAGPFRFNLSKSGLGMSVGVKGFRLGAGPRGNYVHMGRGGLYYRATLGRTHRTDPSLVTPPVEIFKHSSTPIESVESGSLVDMVPSNGSEILKQINEKMALYQAWPSVFLFCCIITIFLSARPQTENLLVGSLFVAIVSTAVAAYLDKQRKTVVILYDLEEATLKSFEDLARAFDRLSRAQRIWNIDDAGRTNDWKRNAGASILIGRKSAQLTYKTPAIVKTNIGVPSIIGGSQAVYFFPNVVLVMNERNAGAITYDHLNVSWSTGVFIETDSVPDDTRIIGHTWRFVNKDGGPDRRFNNNRQIPKVLYQEMGLSGPGEFRKVLQISKLEDRSDFSGALVRLRGVIRDLERPALPPVANPPPSR